MKKLSEAVIQEMRQVRDKLISDYGERDKMLDRYEEIYFMTRGEKPRSLKGTDESDIKETISSSGRDAVQGLKRILDSGDVQIEVTGEGGDPTTVVKGLKEILSVSGLYRMVTVEKDLNLSTALHGPGILTVNLVDDLIEAQKKEVDAESGYAEVTEYKNEFVAKKLEMLREITPFLLDVINARQSYPLFGKWGMVGHAQKYKVKGAELMDMFGVTCDPNEEYEVKDFFYYTNRLVEATGISEPLMATEWVARHEKTGEIIGSINIPVFVRHAGGSSLFVEPDKQSQPLLYAKAKGNWDLRENLFYTYLFSSIYQQGLPGPILVVDPENADQEIEVDYRKGVRTIVAKGKLENPQVIDGDVMGVRNILTEQASSQTIQPQTLGQNTNGVTFSQFAMASKAGLIPAIDPKEAQEALYGDAFTHILQRIQAESIDNKLIPANAIPKKVKVKVTIAPDLEQDDLRNATVAQQLLASGADVSKKWVNTNLLKITDTDEMWNQKALEQMRDAMLQLVVQDPNVLGPMVQKVLKIAPPPTPPQQKSADGEGGSMPVPGDMPVSGAGMEQLPKTEAMVPENERQ
jgi:hypothetical protein